MDFRRVDNLPPYVLRRHPRADARAPSRRRRRRRPRLRQPRSPLPRPRRREARRGGPEPAKPPLFGLEGHPEPSPRSRDAVQAQVRSRSRSGHAGAEHDRRQGRALAPDVGAPRAGRLGARPEPELPDPHPRADLRRRVRDPGADGGRRGSVREPRGRMGARAAQAARRHPLVPAQPDHGDRRSRLHGAASSRSHGSTSCSSSTISPTPISRSTATSLLRSSRYPVRTRSRSSSTR